MSPSSDVTSPSPTPNGEPASGRDERGRFVKNNPGGKGNPFARRVAALRAALIQDVTAEQMRALCARLMAMACGGDLAAAKLLLGYVVGRPAPPVDPDALDQHEWQLCRTSAVPSEELTDAMAGVPIPFARYVVQSALPGIAQGMADGLTENLAELAQIEAEEAAEDAELDAREEEGDEEEAPSEAAPASQDAGAVGPSSIAAILAALGLASLPLPGLPGAGCPTIPLSGRPSAAAPARRCANPASGGGHPSRHPTGANGGGGPPPTRQPTGANGGAAPGAG